MDPANEEIIQGVYKKSIREGEERLMQAVLESAVEDFQKYVLARKPKGKKLFQYSEKWFLEKDDDQLFFFEYICATLQFAQRLRAAANSERRIDCSSFCK